LILTERGQTSVKLNIDAPMQLMILVVHPTSDKISFQITGQVESIQSQKLEEHITFINFTVNRPGNFTITLTADAESSINPSYVSIKGEPLVHTRSYPVTWDSRTFLVTINTNSTISDLLFDQSVKQISYKISGGAGTYGFSNVTIPKELISGPFTLNVDDTPIEAAMMENATHISLHFTYEQVSHEVKLIGTYVIPEFPVSLIATLTAAVAGIILVSILRRQKSHSHFQP